MVLPNQADTKRISTGIAGLDEILQGGLTRDRLYLVEGDPGSGKTTLALQFLLDGLARGESGLYVTLSETRAELIAVGASHGWDLSKIEIYEMSPPDATLSSEQQLTMFHPSEIELSETMKSVLEHVQRIKPQRVVFDSLSEMRLLAQHPLRYRRQILALKQFFAGQGVTLLLLDDGTEPEQDQQLQSLAHGVIHLSHRATEYGADRRQLRIVKMRGMRYAGGLHDFVIRQGGLDVFNRLSSASGEEDTDLGQIKSGITMLDELLGGGLPQGSSTLLLGPAGSGKSTIGLQLCLAAAERGKRAAMYIFDETIVSLKTRARKLGMKIDQCMEKGLFTVQQVDPAELSPGEFAATIRRAVTAEDGSKPAKVIMVDSLNGYLHSMSQEKQMNAQMHELLTYLVHHGVTTLLTVTQSGMIGSAQFSPVDTTYLADNVLLFRYFESFGTVRRAISVVKKRSGSHERTIRELFMGPQGISLGPPLSEFQGILTGVPTFHGEQEQLLDRDGKHAH